MNENILERPLVDQKGRAVLGNGTVIEAAAWGGVANPLFTAISGFRTYNNGVILTSEWLANKKIKVPEFGLELTPTIHRAYTTVMGSEFGVKTKQGRFVATYIALRELANQTNLFGGVLNVYGFLKTGPDDGPITTFMFQEALRRGLANINNYLIIVGPGQNANGGRKKQEPDTVSVEQELEDLSEFVKENLQQMTTDYILLAHARRFLVRVKQGAFFGISADPSIMNEAQNIALKIVDRLPGVGLEFELIALSPITVERRAGQIRQIDPARIRDKYEQMDIVVKQSSDQLEGLGREGQTLFNKSVRYKSWYQNYAQKGASTAPHVLMEMDDIAGTLEQAFTQLGVITWQPRFREFWPNQTPANQNNGSDFLWSVESGDELPDVNEINWHIIGVDMPDIYNTNSVRKTIKEINRKIAIWEQQKAASGDNTSPDIIISIEDCETAIKVLKQYI